MSETYKRAFLNPKSREGMAAISMRFQKVKETEYEGSVVISDCNRQVSLDFDFWTPKMRRERLAKLKILIDYFTELKEKIEGATLKKF